MHNHVQDTLTSSTAERFLRRKPKSLLPNSIEREVDWRSMLTERTNKTTKHVQSKKEKKSREEFKINILLYCSFTMYEYSIEYIIIAVERKKSKDTK